jgi:N-acetylglucosamine kinase-like BadF-type ATPase
VVNDSIGALRAGTPDGIGVSIVCGTGSSIGARAGGATWHASFWGEDNGAVALGRAGLRAVVRSELGLDPPTDLAPRALAAFEVATVDALLHTVTRRGTATSIVAGLAPVVLEAADAGDAAALGIVTRSGSTLGSYARVAAERVGLDDRPFALVLAGGVFRHPSLVLRGSIASALPRARPIASEFEPAVGALFLAFDGIGRKPDLATLRRTMPPGGFFASDATASGRSSAGQQAAMASAGMPT